MAKKVKKAETRKPKPGTKAVVQPKPRETPKSQQTTKALSAKQMADLLRASRIAKKDYRGISDRFGKLMAGFPYLDKQAFAPIRIADGMEPERLRVFLDNLLHYFEISGLNARADSVVPMKFGPGDEEEDDDAEADTDAPAGNVTPLRAAE